MIDESRLMLILRVRSCKATLVLPVTYEPPQAVNLRVDRWKTSCHGRRISLVYLRETLRKLGLLQEPVYGLTWVLSATGVQRHFAPCCFEAHTDKQGKSCVIV